MNIDDFDELVRKQNKNVVTRDFRVGVSGFDEEVKKVNKNNLTPIVRRPPGFSSVEEEPQNPFGLKPSYLSQGTFDTRKEDTAFTKLGRIALPSFLEKAFKIDETQRKPKPTTRAEDIQMIGNAQTIEMMRRNPEDVSDLAYLKSGLSFGNNLTKNITGYEYDIAPSDLPEPVKLSQKVAYGVGNIITMTLAQPLIESAFVSMVSKIPGGAGLISKVSEAARLSPWKIGYPMAITKAGFEGGLFGLITENKHSVARNVLETGGTFAAFTAIAFPIAQFFKPVLEKVGSSNMVPNNSRKIANDALNAIKTQETTGVVWFRNPNDPSQLLKVTVNGVESVEKNAPGVILAGSKDASTLTSVEIEAFRENPSLYNQLKEWLGGKKINVPFEPPIVVPNTPVEVPKTPVVDVNVGRKWISKDGELTIKSVDVSPAGTYYSVVNSEGKEWVYKSDRLEKRIEDDIQNADPEFRAKQSDELQKGIDEAKRQSEIKAQKAAEARDLKGYENELTPKAVGLAQKILNVSIRLEDGTIISRKDLIIKRLGEGWTLNADKDLLKQPGKDYGQPLNKTEGDFARYISEKGPKTEVVKSPESKIFEQGKSGLEDTKVAGLTLAQDVKGTQQFLKDNGIIITGRGKDTAIMKIPKELVDKYRLDMLFPFQDVPIKNGFYEHKTSGAVFNLHSEETILMRAIQDSQKIIDDSKIDAINASKPEGNEPFDITPTVKDRTPFNITPTAPPSTEPFIPKEDISGEQVSRNLELIAEDINQKIQEKADSVLANIENPTPEQKADALQEAKDFIKNYIQMEGDRVVRPDILVSKTQVKEMLSGLEQDVIEMKAILKDGKKYLHFKRDEGVGSKVKTDILLKPSALGLVEGNIKIGDTLKIDVKKLKPKGTSMRAVDSDGNIMASKGGQPIGKFEQQTMTPEKSVADSYKLFEKVNEMIKKYAERVGEQYLPRGAKGVYYHGSTRNIRLTSMNELSTAAHEISHYLDEQFDITSKFMAITGYSVKGNPIYDPATAKIRKDITKIYTTYYHGAKDDHKLKLRMSEGFATLIQKYVEMPTTIEQNFPDAVKQILKPGGEFYNDTIGQMLGELKKIVVDFQALTPLDQIGAVVTSDKNKTGKASFLNFLQRFRTEVADEIYPIEVLANRAGVGMTASDPSLWLRMYGLSSSYVINNLSGNKGYWRLKGGDLVKTNDSNWKTLLDRLNKEKSFDSFGAFLVGRDQHFQFQNLQKLKDTAVSDALAYKNELQGIDAESDPEDIAYVKSLKLIADKSKQAYEELKVILDKNGIAEATATKGYEENLERFKEEADLFDQLTREDIEFAHDNAVGLLSDEKYKEFIGKEGYAPLKREFYDDILGDEEGVSRTPAGTKVSTFKSRTGSSRTILHPVESAIKAHAEITRKGLKQVVYNSIGKSIASKFPELFQVQQLKTVPDKNTGGFIFPQEKDPNIIMAIINGKKVPILTDRYVKGIIDDVMTYHDIHILENILLTTSRIFTKGTTAAYPAFLLSNMAMDTISSTAQTQTKMVPIISAVKELYKAIADKSSIEAQLLTKYLVSGGDRQTLVGWQNMSANELLAAVTHERKGILKVLDLFNQGVDILSIPSKYSEIFTRSTEYIRSVKQGDSHIVALEKAGRVSAPFHHTGRLGGGRVGKTYVKTIPFFNPAIQVLDQTARTFETPEGRARASFVMAALATLVVSGTIAVIAVGTEKQKRLLVDLTPEELNMFIYYPNPDGETLGRMRIPENYSWAGGILNMGIIDKKLNAHYSSLDYINAASSFMPNQLQPWQPEEWVFSMLPQGIKVPTLLATGKKDFPKVMDIESQGQKNKEPQLRYTDQTSVVAKWLGKEFNMSPLKIDALITGALGRASGFVTVKPSAYKISSTVSRSEYFDSGRSMQLYYDLKKENDLKTKSIKNRLREFTPEEKTEVLKLNNILSQIDGVIDRYRKVDEEKYPERAEELKQTIYRLINEKLRNQ